MSLETQVGEDVIDIALRCRNFVLVSSRQLRAFCNFAKASWPRFTAGATAFFTAAELRAAFLLGAVFVAAFFGLAVVFFLAVAITAFLHIYYQGVHWKNSNKLNGVQ